jgi:hypothetical protein
VSGGAGEREEERELRPPLGQVRVRQRELEHPDDVLQEGVDLLGAPAVDFINQLRPPFM